MKIVLIGPQGCGKGTLASMLVKVLKIPTISLGEIFRTEASRGTKEGLEAKSYMDRGVLVPTPLSFKMLKKRLDEEDAKNGFILDAYPRTLEQAQLLDSIAKIDKVIHLQVADEIVIRRLETRRSCRKCGRIYSTARYTKPVCECGGELYIRDDDTPQAIEKRLSVYHETVQPILDFYKAKKVLVEIDGGGTPEEVFAKAMEILK